MHRDEVYAEALQKGYNILIEVAPSPNELLFNIDFEELARFGYDIEAYILAVSEENSLLSIHERFEGQIEANMQSPKLTDFNRARESFKAVEIVIKDLIINHPEVSINLLKRAVITGNEEELPEPIFITDDKSILLAEYRESVDEDRDLTMKEADERIDKVKTQMGKRGAISAHVNQFEDVCNVIKNTKQFQ